MPTAAVDTKFSTVVTAVLAVSTSKQGTYIDAECSRIQRGAEVVAKPSAELTRLITPGARRSISLCYVDIATSVITDNMYCRVV